MTLGLTIQKGRIEQQVVCVSFFSSTTLDRHTTRDRTNTPHLNHLTQPVSSITVTMQAFYFAFFVLLSLLGLGSADDGDYPECANEDTHCQDYVDFDNPLPAYMIVHCSDQQVPEESRIKTMARMMDWSVHLSPSHALPST